MYRLLILVLTLISNLSFSQPSSNSIVYEGKGMDSLSIGSLDASQVKAHLGTNYMEINHENYSIEILYKDFGASFYHFLGSDTSKIFAIGVYDNYQGKTAKGFSIISMRVSDMLSIYGKPRWNMLASANMLYAHYDKLGIYFGINPKEELPEEFVSYSDDNKKLLKRMDKYYTNLYRDAKVVEISIGKPGTKF